MTDLFLVSLEDHFICATFGPSVTERLSLHQFPGPLRDQLMDVGPARLAVMDSARVRLQVVSHVPFPLDADLCKVVNDDLAARCQEHPKRFAGFAALPVLEPAQIAGELRRCVRDLGFVGALIPNHANGRYFEGPEYESLWATAEQLDVPIYLHPCAPPADKRRTFDGAYSSDTSFAIATHAWDWHADCGMHFVRLFAAGVFERHPRLKLVLGHLGEMVPFMLGRVERKLALTDDSKVRQRTFQEVYEENVWLTTTGMMDPEVFRFVAKATPMEHIMFSIDYPFENSVASLAFLQGLQKDGTLSEKDFQRVAHGNAEQLFARAGKGIPLSDTAANV